MAFEEQGTEPQRHLANPIGVDRVTEWAADEMTPVAHLIRAQNAIAAALAAHKAALGEALPTKRAPRVVKDKA